MYNSKGKHIYSSLIEKHEEILIARGKRKTGIWGRKKNKKI